MHANATTTAEAEAISLGGVGRGCEGREPEGKSDCEATIHGVCSDLVGLETLEKRDRFSVHCSGQACRSEIISKTRRITLPYRSSKSRQLHGV
jgi:hypothetical protein